MQDNWCGERYWLLGARYLLLGKTLVRGARHEKKLKCGGNQVQIEIKIKVEKERYEVRGENWLLGARYLLLGKTLGARFKVRGTGKNRYSVVKRQILRERIGSTTGTVLLIYRAKSARTVPMVFFWVFAENQEH